MAKTKKITTEELELIVGLQTKINSIITNIGILEVQKHNGLHDVSLLNRQVDEHKNLLLEKYGDVNLDIKDGSYVDNPVTGVTNGAVMNKA